MPSLPPRDGVTAPPCAGICAGASTVSTDDSPNGVVGTSLPLLPTGELDAIGSLSGTFGIAFPSLLHALQEHGGECTRARSHDRSYGSSAPAPMSFGASMPTYSPHHLNIMGGGYSPTTQTSTPLVGVTPSCHPTAIVEWADRASAEAVSEYAHEILAYWDAIASPHEQTVIGHGIGGILIPAKMARLAKS